MQTIEKWSPGTWEVCGQSQGGRYITVAKTQGARKPIAIARVPFGPLDLRHAHLIASAPDLLEALKVLIVRHSAFLEMHGRGDEAASTLAHAAIAKASGPRSGT